jgi:hypothetical protein
MWFVPVIVIAILESLFVFMYFNTFDLRGIDFFAAHLNLEYSGNSGLPAWKNSYYFKADNSETNTT